MAKLQKSTGWFALVAFATLLTDAVLAGSAVSAGEWITAPGVQQQQQPLPPGPEAGHGIYFPSRAPSTRPSIVPSIIKNDSETQTNSAITTKPIISLPAKSSAAVITENQATVTPKTDKHLKPFLEVVRANFQAWDLNHDDVIDRKELETAMQDARFTGDAAAALAVLKIDADARVAAKKELGLSRLTDLDAIQTKSDNGEKLDPDFGRMFAKATYKLKSEPRQLYIDALPHLSTIHQASTQDCYFLSSVGGLLETNPRAIVDMIQLNADGTYNVTFPGKPPLVIPAPTEAEIAAYTNANDGFWLIIIEKAYGKVRHIAPENYTAEPLDTAALYGGSCVEVIRLLTGHHTTRINFQVPPAVPLSCPALQPVPVSALQTALV